MRKYETIFILNPAIEEEAVKANNQKAIDKIDELLKK